MKPLTIEIVLSDPWPSQNEINKWLWTPPGQRKLGRLKADWFEEVAYGATRGEDLILWRKAGRPYFRRVLLERYGPRVLDRGNLVGGAKFHVDALVKAGWIEDDSPDKVTIEYRQHTGPKFKPYRTRITLMKYFKQKRS